MAFSFISDDPNFSQIGGPESTGYSRWQANPFWETYKPTWQMVRDCVRGSASVINPNRQYLLTPQLNKNGEPGVDIRAYNKYAQIANYTNFPKSAQALALGVLHDEDYMFEVPEGLTDFKESVEKNVDLQGSSLKSFLLNCTEDELQTGSSGCLTEFLPVNGELNDADYEKIRNKLSYLRHMKAEQIVDWDIKQMNFGDGLEASKLVEMIEMNQNSVDTMLAQRYGLCIFSITTPHLSGSNYYVNNSYLMCGIDENGEYYQEVYERYNRQSFGDQNFVDIVRNEARPYFFFGNATANVNNAYVRKGERYYPMPDGMNRMNYIPFDRYNGMMEPAEPFLNEICVKSLKYMNKGTFRDYSEWKDATNKFIAYIGMDKGDDFKSGNDVFTGQSNGLERSDVKSVQFDPEVTRMLNESLMDTRKEISSISILPLSPESRMIESAEAVSIKNASKNNMLAVMAHVMSNVMEKKLKQLARTRGYDEELVSEIKFKIQPDFSVEKMDPEMVDMVLQVKDSGVINNEQAHEKLKEIGFLGKDDEFTQTNEMDEEDDFGNTPE